MTLAVTREPPLEPQGPSEPLGRSKPPEQEPPDPAARATPGTAPGVGAASTPGPVDEAVLTAYGMVEAAGLLSGVSLELWEHLPEDFCRDHELDRGRLITRQSGSRGHQTASRRLANALEKAARSAVGAGAYACLTVNQDVDVRLWDVPAATVRRPDVLVHRCLDPGADLWAEHLLLAVEIVSPTSRATDTGRDNPDSGFESKMTQYARVGIKHYWIVRLKPDDSAIESIEEWRSLDRHPEYTLAAVWTAEPDRDAVGTESPFRIEISWTDLDF
ncbi:Uma2 family endonuclease [Catenulispora yoronensis]